MKLRISSFRTRIFLVTTLIVVLILLCVMAMAWINGYAQQVKLLDTRLCSEAQRLVTQPMSETGFKRFEGDVAAKLQLQSTSQLLLWLQGNPARPPLHSDAWPEGLDPKTFAWGKPTKPSGPPPDAARPNHMGEPGEPPPRRPEPEGNGRPRPGDNGPGQDPNGINAELGSCALTTFKSMGEEWRAARYTTLYASGLLAADLTFIRAGLRDTYKSITLGVAPLALLLTGMGAWLLSLLAMRPVNRLRVNMQAVNQKVLNQRVTLDQEDHEFRSLIDAYNKMLDRLELSFHQASRFSADAAHELRTPLTILQGQIEQALRMSDGQSNQVHLSQMLDETGRLSGITRKLLLLSQADAGHLALMLTPVDISHMLKELLNDAQMLDLQNVTISGDLGDHIAVHADGQLVGQLLNNLCSNAFKYTPPGGWIKAKVRTLPTGVEVLLSNSAAGITLAMRARLFDRFFRGDAAHGRATDGHGLGLSLAREIARAHGGDLTLQDSPLDAVHLRLWLPTA